MEPGEHSSRVGWIVKNRLVELRASMFPFPMGSLSARSSCLVLRRVLFTIEGGDRVKSIVAFVAEDVNAINGQ